MKIAFWTGYSPAFPAFVTVDENFEINEGWGSESSLTHLSVEFFKLGHEVDIYCLMEGEVPFNSADYDIVIVSRYLNYFLYEFSKCPNTYLWLHDVTPIGYYDFKVLPLDGEKLYSNIQNHLVKTVVLSPSHKQIMIDNYGAEAENLEIIGHGLLPPSIDIDQYEKNPGKLLWTSCWNRGLPETIEMINLLDGDKYNIELDVFGLGKDGPRTFEHYEERKPSLRELVDNSPHKINFHEYATDTEIEEAWAKCDIWFYPTVFTETYCISALEAQRAGCFCLTSNVGALHSTVGNRGVTINPYPHGENYPSTMANLLKYYLDNPGDTIPFREAGKIWADTQSMENIAKRWIDMFEREMRTFK
jgi:glycosyltransferase involved in cell wall biosynthesis|tara:strand:+ start:47895 stop:48974 length:1080 start_codon:yes stop_codon:yes gene_type:complete